MFWDAVVEGLYVLTYWETYVAGLQYFVLFWVPTFVLSMVTMQSERAEGSIGCLLMFVMPAFQVFALVVFVLTLSPIILGLSDDAAWTFPWTVASEAPVALAGFVATLLLAALILAIVPILAGLQSLHTMLLGALALELVLSILKNAYPGAVPDRVQWWPGFWFVLGLLIIGGAMTWIGIMVAALFITAGGRATEGVGQLLMVPIAATFGFIPLFIYGAWLGAQLRGAG